jgi:CcmD family protein
MNLLLAQITQDDLHREWLRLQHDYQFLTYGLIAAWVILAVYVLMMIGRQKKLKREIESLRVMVEEKQASGSAR